jgi:hypothetical protein
MVADGPLPSCHAYSKIRPADRVIVSSPFHGRVKAVGLGGAVGNILPEPYR